MDFLSIEILSSENWVEKDEITKLFKFEINYCVADFHACEMRLKISMISLIVIKKITFGER